MNNNLEKQKNFISSVIYLGNNQETIKNFLMYVDIYFSKAFLAYEYVIVNNSSEDKSISIIKEIKNLVGGKITIVNLSGRHTKDNAMAAGQDIAIGDYVFEFDEPVVDFSTEDLEKVYKKSLEGYDVVSASNKRKLSILSKFYNKVISALQLKKKPVKSESLRVISRRAINRVYKEKNSFIYRKLAYEKSGFDTFHYYYEGKKVNQNNNECLSMKLSVRMSILFKYTNFTTKYIVGLSILFIVFLGISIVRESLWIILLFLIFGVLLSLVISLKFLSDIYNEVIKKPLYIFKSVDRL